jgi:hypothetical protein
MRNWAMPITAAACLAALAPALVAQVRGSADNQQAIQPAPRRPRGIYAVVNIEDDITQQRKANPSITPPALNAYFENWVCAGICEVRWFCEGERRRYLTRLRELE